MLNVKSAINKLISLMVHCDDKLEFRILHSSLTTLLRKWCDQKPIVYISECALIKANQLDVNLFEMQWRDQPKFDEGRKIFHYEHKYPVSDMIQDMLVNPDKIEIILSKYQVGWILKVEDAKLPKNNRVNHNLAYENAGIKLIYNN